MLHLRRVGKCCGCRDQIHAAQVFCFTRALLAQSIRERARSQHATNRHAGQTMYLVKGTENNNVGSFATSETADRVAKSEVYSRYASSTTTTALCELSRRKLLNASSSLIVPVGVWGFIRYIARVLAVTFDLSATKSFWYCAFKGTATPMPPTRAAASIRAR